MKKKDDCQTDDAPVAARPWWWRLLGLRRRRGRWLRVTLTIWGWLLLILVIGVIGAGGFAEYSMKPDFCRSCHLMEPYYEAWHRSTHKDVDCVECHFEPGWRNTLKGKWQASSQVAKYLTRTYGSKPHAEISDASCLQSGCHEQRVLEGKVRWAVTASDGQPIEIMFDHTPHLTELRRGKRLKCVSCHSQIVQGEHLVVTLDSCFTCHFKGLKHGRDSEVLGGCRSCHDAPKQEIEMPLGLFNHKDFLDRGVACENCHSDSIKGDGDVPRQVCGHCHNKADHLGRYGDTEFLHATHVTDRKVECTHCHTQIEHRLNTTKGDAIGACATCHEGSHGGPTALYRGVGGRGVPDMPSPMSRTQVDCIACHRHRELPGDVAAVVGQTFTAVSESCTYCHGPKYDKTLAEWHERIAGLQAASDEVYAQAEAAVEQADLPPAALRRARILLADARHNRRLVELGRGVHNVNYATALLSTADEFCQRAVDIVDRGPETPRP